MKINYTIEKFPKKKPLVYDYFIEGKIYIQYNGLTVLMLPEWPLIEFLVAILNWKRSLISNPFSDFYYISMESDEKPILSFTYKKKLNMYEIDSCWLEINAFNVPKEDILKEVNAFYLKFKNQILKEYNYNIELSIPKWSEEIGIP